jgi:hypothetical protein
MVLMSSSTAESLRDRLAAARRHDFVGRQDELALFEALLDAGRGGVVHVHGPGGIGKSSLLHQFAWLGLRRGRRVVRFDAADCGQSAATVVVDVARVAGVADEADPLGALAGLADLVLLIDTADQLAPLDRWLREEFLVRLAAGTLVVLAGRNRPGLGWRTDPGWRSLSHAVHLRELSVEDSRAVLCRRGLPASACESVLAFARGHPLALALAAEIGPELPDRLGAPGAPPEALRDLLGVLLDTVPSPLHRAALEASSQVLVTTEALLAALLGEPDAHGLFGWLCELPIMEYTERGVRPHDLLRDLLAADLRWRDPDGVARLRRRARDVYHRRLDGGEPVLFDLAYLHRDNDVLGPFLSCVTPSGSDPGELAITPMRAGEWPALRALLVRHEGAGSADLVDRWASPETVSVVRDAGGGAAAFMVLLALHAVDPADRAADPATAAAWRCVESAGGSVLYLRCWLDAEHYQAISPAQTRMIFHLVRLFLTVRDLTYSFLPVAEPLFWADLCAYIGLDRMTDADFTVGGHRYGVYGHDWRAVPPSVWLQRLAEPAVPDQGFDFGAAVRAALKDLGRPDLLAASPLTRTAMVARAGADVDPGRALDQVIREAAAVLQDSARDRRAYRALHHTYLQPAGTQQRAAELLDLPMSTYRRHLAEGVERLTALLWRQEQADRAENGQNLA